MIAQIKITERNGMHQARVSGLAVGRESIGGLLATGESSGEVLNSAIQATDSLIKQLESIRSALCESAQDGLELVTTIEVDDE